MDDQFLLAILGIMALLGLLLVVLFLLLLRLRRKGQSRTVGETPSPSGPKVARAAIIWPEEGQSLIWTINGQRYEHPDRVTSDEHRLLLATFLEALGRTLPTLPETLKDASRQLSETIRPLDAPAGGTRDALPSSRPVDYSKADSTVASLPGGQTPVENMPAPGARTRPLSYEEELDQPLVERIRASFWPGRATESGSSARLEKLEKPAIPQIDELDQILQVKLALVPDAPRSTIRTGVNGLLEIVVGEQIYERIKDVPNPDVRDAMEAAVRMWEGTMS